MSLRSSLLVLVLLAPTALAVDFTEDFEGFTLGGLAPELKPDQDWYDYSERDDTGNNTNAEAIEGAQAFKLGRPEDEDPSISRATFTLEVPAQITQTTFWVRGTTPADNTLGSQQYVALESSAPVRKIAEFYVHCNDPNAATACELKVRWRQSDTTGITLINTTVNDKQFKIDVHLDWLDAEFCLFVDDVDDGCFPMLELPKDFGRLRFQKTREDVPMGLLFDNWTVFDGVEGEETAVQGDAANGIKNFAVDAGFRSTTSQWFLGFLILGVLLAAVLIPVRVLGESTTLAPAAALYAVAVVLWLVFMELWPAWVGILLIIITAALIGTVVRRLLLGIRDASGGAGLIAGTLGYFIIATSLLATSGYATQTIEVPADAIDDDDVNATTQSFVGAVSECVFTLFKDCSQKTKTKTFKLISNLATWARAAAAWLFQLLTFQLPIPVIFNAMIVLPPAAALAYQGFAYIRGIGS